MRKPAFYIEIQSLSFLNSKFYALAIFCGCTARFVSALVRNPKDRFSSDMSHLMIIAGQFLIVPKFDSDLSVCQAH